MKIEDILYSDLRSRRNVERISDAKFALVTLAVFAPIIVAILISAHFGIL